MSLIRWFIKSRVLICYFDKIKYMVTECPLSHSCFSFHIYSISYYCYLCRWNYFCGLFCSCFFLFYIYSSSNLL